MPKSKSWGAGRKCLFVGAADADDAAASALAGAAFEVVSSQTEAEALARLADGGIALAVVSLARGPLLVSSIIARAAQQHPEVPVIVLGASVSVQEAVDAMQLGAADYVVPPLTAEGVLARVRRVLERQAPALSSPSALAAPLSGIVGSSAAIRRLLTSMEKISRYKTNVLVLGESGTGKELIARALHARGPRRQHLFVPLNCATLGRELLENELFGHEKGAFTGANERKKGLFELADGGTLFLDEIGEMDPATQAKLLRVIERNEFRRVGGTHKVKVDLGVIAATNRKLEDAIQAGKFREDLYYRLKVVTLVVPPLREHKEDIPALIDTFIADFNRRNDGKIQGIAPPALKLIMEYDWPGNVRELKNAIESAAILAASETIGLEGFADLQAKSPPPASTPRAAPPAASDHRSIVIPVGSSLAEAEKQLITATLARYRTKRQAAQVLGLGLRTLYTKLHEYGLAPEGAESA